MREKITFGGTATSRSDHTKKKLSLSKSFDLIV